MTMMIIKVIAFILIFNILLAWTKFEKKKKEKLNRKEQRTRNLVNTDSLIFSACKEQIKNRRRFYGNLKWYRLDLKNWHTMDANQVHPNIEYYRNIRRPILNCKNSIKCPSDTLNVRKFQEISHIFRNSLKTLECNFLP